MKIFPKLSAFLFVGAILFLGTNTVYGEAFEATDAIGQIRQNVPVYTASGPNNSPNEIGVNAPSSVAVDTVNNRLFVGDAGNDRVLIFELNEDGELVSSEASYVLGQEDLDVYAEDGPTSDYFGVIDLEYDADNDRLFVADGRYHRVLVFDVDPATLANGNPASYVLGKPDFVSTQGGVARELDNIKEIQAIAYDSVRELLFVGDSIAGRVGIFDVAPETISNGAEMIFRLGNQSVINEPFPVYSQSSTNQISSLEYDQENNRLFVGDGDTLGGFGGNTNGSQRVLVFDMTEITNGENAVNVLGQADFVSDDYTSADASSFLDAEGVAYDPTGDRLFVSDKDNNRVLVFAVDAILDNEAAVNVLGQADFTSIGADTTIDTLRGPVKSAYDAVNDKLWVVDQDNNRVLSFDGTALADGEDALDVVGHTMDGSQDFNHGGANNGPGLVGLNEPRDLIVDTTHHRMFILDTENKRIVVHTLDADNELTDYDADYVLAQEDMYSELAVVSAEGVSFPVAIAFDPTGNRLFVADQIEGTVGRVLVFDTASITNGEAAVNVLGQANFVSEEEPVTSSSSFYPASLVYDDATNYLFVGDENSNRVLVFDATTVTDNEAAVHVLGQADFDTTHELEDPSDATFTGSLSGMTHDGSRLFVSDYYANRVLVFNVATLTDGESATHVLGQDDFVSSGNDTSATTMTAPRGLAYSSRHKRLFVADSGNNRILGFNVRPNQIENGMSATVVLGQEDFESSGQGLGVGSMWGPSGVAYDLSNKRIYVVDLNNNRILAYNHVKINTMILPDATVNQEYHEEIDTTATQGTVSFTLADGTLPPGMEIGSVAGIPTEPGDYTFTIEAQDTVNGAGMLLDDQEFTLTVLASSSGSSGSSRRRTVCAPTEVIHPQTGRTCEIWTAPQIAQAPAPVPETSPLLSEFNFGTVMVKYGTRGEFCKAWQMFLNTKSYDLAVDGICGQLTMAAAKKWQASAGLIADGLLGPVSRAKALGQQ